MVLVVFGRIRQTNTKAARFSAFSLFTFPGKPGILRAVKTQIILSILSLALPGNLSAAPRTWTSADGRTIEAEYLGRAPDGSALVLLRTDTSARVTVPVAALSEADREHADTLPRTPAPAAEKKPEKPAFSPALAALIASWPAPSIPASLRAGDPYLVTSHADVAELRRRYDADLRSIASGNLPANARALRLKIERDLVRLRADGAPSASRTPDGEKKAGAARAGAYWLTAQILPHLALIEAEAAK